MLVRVVWLEVMAQAVTGDLVALDEIEFGPCALPDDLVLSKNLVAHSPEMIASRIPEDTVRPRETVHTTLLDLAIVVDIAGGGYIQRQLPWLRPSSDNDTLVRNPLDSMWVPTRRRGPQDLAIANLDIALLVGDIDDTRLSTGGSHKRDPAVARDLADLDIGKIIPHAAAGGEAPVDSVLVPFL